MREEMTLARSDRPKWPRLGLDLVSLRFILAAAEEHSFAAAAQRENTSLSAVSRRIAELEGRIGVTLFDRRDRGVTLTEAGKSFVSQIYDLFEQLDRMALELEAVRGGAQGLVRLHAHMAATAGDLPDRLASFIEANPGIEIVLVEETSAAVIHAVAVGTADLGLVSGTIPTTPLTMIPWQEDELVVLLPKDDELVSRDAIRLEDMVARPFIGMQRDSALLSLYRQQVNALGGELDERAHATSFESVRHMVALGSGVSILPSAAAYPYADELGYVIKPLNESWARRSLMLCTRELESCSAVCKLLIAHLLGESGARD